MQGVVCFCQRKRGPPMQTRSRYRIQNWTEYNRALIQRGSITVWIDENSIKKWLSSFHTCKAGRPETYSDDAILMMLILREVYSRSLRSLQGFVQFFVLCNGP